jgi:hypothetical protein
LPVIDFEIGEHHSSIFPEESKRLFIPEQVSVKRSCFGNVGDLKGNVGNADDRRALSA